MQHQARLWFSSSVNPRTAIVEEAVEHGIPGWPSVSLYGTWMNVIDVLHNGTKGVTECGLLNFGRKVSDSELKLLALETSHWWRNMTVTF